MVRHSLTNVGYHPSKLRLMPVSDSLPVNYRAVKTYYQYCEACQEGSILQQIVPPDGSLTGFDVAAAAAAAVLWQFKLPVTLQIQKPCRVKVLVASCREL
jgi:hypothetical protein